MSLLTVVRDVCAVTGVAAPSSVIASINTNRTMFEMLNCANVMAQRTAYDSGRDWQALITQQFMYGDGLTEALPLPVNYKRMLLNSNVYKVSAPTMPMRFVSDMDEWMRNVLNNRTNTHGEWIIYGGEIHFFPLLGTVDVDGNPVPGSETVIFNYLDRNCVRLASGGYGDRFVADEDTFRLDERLLQLGMIWQWKAWKGSPYAEDMGAWSDAIAMEMGHDKPSPILIGRAGSTGMSSYPFSSGQTWAWPFNDGTVVPT